MVPSDRRTAQNTSSSARSCAPDPMVSIVMPVYNSHSTVAWAIASVLAQDNQDWELIVVDDSTPSLSFLVESLSDNRIIYTRPSERRGRGYARALALDMARGRYLAMVDSDDWAYPWKITRQLRLLEQHSDVVAVGSPMAVVNSRNEISGMRGHHGSGLWIMKGTGSPVAQPMCFPTAIFRMSVARRTGFRTDLRGAEDADFMMRALGGQYFAIHSEALYAYRHEYGVTCNTSLQNLTEWLGGNRERLRACFDRFPFYARLQAIKSYAYFTLNVYRSLSSRILRTPHHRDRKPTALELEHFCRARDEIALHIETHFANRS